MAGVHGDEADARRLQRTRRQVERGRGKLAGLCRLLDEHGDAIEADLRHVYGVELTDFYRGKVSPRSLEVLVRGLPAKSRTSTAVNGGVEVWSRIENLLADLWVVLVQANSEKGSLPEEFDHPERAKATAAAKAESKQTLKELFLQLKRRHSSPRGGDQQ